MTSQIAIYNSLGVAVASDTVTTHSRDNSVKTSNNAQKLWTLGSDHLVVVAHSGSVFSNGINVRLLATEWNRALGAPFKLLSDYSSNFGEWVTKDNNLVQEESEIKAIHNFLNDHFNEVRNRFFADVNSDGFSGDVAERLLFHAGQGFEYLSSLPLFYGASDAADAQLLIDLNINLDEKIDYYFDDIDGFEGVRGILTESAPLVLSRFQAMGSDADLNFVGFGQDEFFPRSVCLHLRGKYGGLARVISDDPFGASVDTISGCISVFAQSDAINGFLRGAQWQILEEAYSYLRSHALEEFSAETSTDIANKMVDGLRQHIADVQTTRFVQPMLDTIGGLDLRGLAELAESLVGMQATRAAAAPGPASVGGFIESVVIDRNEGVRWVNRLAR